MSKKVIILTPSLTPFDAVSNDVLQLRIHLLSLSYDVIIFAEKVHSSLRTLVTNYRNVHQSIRFPDAMLFYHHSIYWKLGEEIVSEALCRLTLKYHNITPPSFFWYDAPLQRLTLMGRIQTSRFVKGGRFNFFVSDSSYNQEELKGYGAPPQKCAIIPPFHIIHDFDTVPIEVDYLRRFDPEIRHVLFVGRVAPNKGHLNLIKTLGRYIDFYGGNIHLHIVGKIILSDLPYLKLLEDEITRRDLGQKISFHDGLSFQDLHSLYSLCDVFLVQSEHEGFCVPVLEAQYHRLPVLAWSQAAVGDTVGAGQIVFNDLDFDLFSAALRRLIVDGPLRETVIGNGLKNFARYESPLLLSKTLELLSD